MIYVITLTLTRFYHELVPMQPYSCAVAGDWFLYSFIHKHFGQSVLIHGHALSELLNTLGDSLLAYESLYIIVMGWALRAGQSPWRRTDMQWACVWNSFSDWLLLQRHWMVFSLSGSGGSWERGRFSASGMGGRLFSLYGRMSLWRHTTSLP